MTPTPESSTGALPIVRFSTFIPTGFGITLRSHAGIALSGPCPSVAARKLLAREVVIEKMP